MKSCRLLWHTDRVTGWNYEVWRVGHFYALMGDGRCIEAGGRSAILGLFTLRVCRGLGV